MLTQSSEMVPSSPVIPPSWEAGTARFSIASGLLCAIEDFILINILGLRWRRPPFCFSQAVVIVISRQWSSIDYKIWTSHRKIRYLRATLHMHFSGYERSHPKTLIFFNFYFIFTHDPIIWIFTYDSEKYCFVLGKVLFLGNIYNSWLSLPVVQLHYFPFRFVISTYF